MDITRKQALEQAKKLDQYSPKQAASRTSQYYQQPQNYDVPTAQSDNLSAFIIKPAQVSNSQYYNATNVNAQKQAQQPQNYDVPTGVGNLRWYQGQMASLKPKLEAAKGAFAQDSSHGAGAYERSRDSQAEYERLTKQYTELEKKATKISQDIALAKQTQSYNAYNKTIENPDFDEYSKQGSELKNPSGEEVTRLFSKQKPQNEVTYSIENALQLRMATHNPKYGDFKYSLMTTDEVNIYNYLLAKEGNESAKKYLESIDEILNYRSGTADAEAVRGIDSGVGRTLATGAFGLYAGLDQAASGMKQVFDSDAKSTSPAQYGSQYIREDLAETGPEFLGSSLGQAGYDLVTVAGNMAPSILLSSVIGGLGIPAAAARAIGSASLGLSASGNAYKQSLDQGYSKDQARTYSTLVGASEGALQYLLGGIGPLSGFSGGKLAQKIAGIDKAIARIALQTGKGMLGKATEEGLQSVLEPIFRTMIFDEELNIDIEEVAYSAVLGALSAGLIGGTSNTTAYISNNRQANRSAQDVVQPPSAIAPAPQGVASQPVQPPTVNQNAIDIKVPTESQNAVQGILEPATAIEPMAKPEAQAGGKIEASANPREQKLISTLSEGNKTVEPFDYNVYGDKIKNGEGDYLSYKVSDGDKSYIIQLQGYTAGAYGNLIQARIAEPDFWRNGAIATNTLSSLDEVATWANEVVDYEKSNSTSPFPESSLGAKITKGVPQTATDTAKAVEVDTAEQGQREGQISKESQSAVGNIKDEQLKSKVEREISNKAWEKAFNEMGYITLSDKEHAENQYQKDGNNLLGAVRAKSDFDILERKYQYEYSHDNSFINSVVDQYNAKENQRNHNKIVEDSFSKPDWQVPQSIMLERVDAPWKKDTIIREHKQSVINALNSGENVPSDVLQDYPDLSTQPNSLFPESSLGAKITKGMPKSNVNAESSVGAATGGFVPETPYSIWSENTANNQFHDVGENAVHSVDLPKINLQGESTMKTAATVMESQNTPDARVEEIQSAMVDGKMAYMPIENKRLAEKANAKIKRNGWQTALNDWTSNVRSGTVSPDLVAEGATLLNNAGNAVECTKEAYINLLTDYANLVHASGQSLQAARILKTLTPEARLYAMQRSVQKINEGINEKSGAKKRAAMNEHAEIKINADLAEKYRKATTDEERDAIVSEIQQDIADQVPSSGLDKWTALRYVNMLGNFKTQARNVAGNATMMGVAKLKNEVAAGLEHAVSAVSGGKFERTKSFVVSKDMYSAAYADFKKVQKVALGEGKYNETNATNDFERGINEKRTIFKVNGEWGTKDNSSVIAKGARSVTDVGMKVLEGYRKITNQAMEVGDVIFSRITYADALAGYLKAHNITAEQLRNGDVDTALMDKARLYAIKEAQESTFRDTNAFSKAVSNFDSNWSKGGKIISKGILPFRKTPANIMVRAEEYSPLGLLNTTVKAIQVAKGSENVSGADVINSLSKTLTGSGILMLGWTLRKMGLLFGKDDDENQSAFNSLTGRQNYSITLPNGTSFTVDWLTPVSMPLFVGANLYDLAAENGLKANDIESVITSITDPIIKMSMMAGVNDALSNIKYSDNNLMQFTLSSAANYLTQGLTNTMLGQIERTSEKVRMSTYTDPTSLVPDWIQRIGGKASAKTPGVDYNQGEYVDAWGRTQNTGATTNKIANNFFNPAYMSTVNETALEKELQRLYDATGESSVVPKRVTDKSFKTYDGEYAMTPSEQVKFQKTRGQYAYKELGTLTKSADYKAMSDEDKIKAVSDIYSAATTNAKQTIVEAHGEMYIPSEAVAKKIETYASTGITKKQAYSVYKSFEALKPEEGEKQVTTYQKVKAISGFGYSDEQAIALAGTLYTTKDEDGAIKKESLLPYLNTSKHLLSLYLTNKDSEMISMTIPETFTSKNVEYTLDDAEKELFKSTYVNYFNAYITNVSGAKTIKSLRDKAFDTAKAAVIQSR